jgi:hypothetical protein
MKSEKLRVILYGLIALLLSVSNKAIGQDTTELIVVRSVSVSFDYSIKHYPTKEDELIYKEHIGLIDTEPSFENYKEYYLLARSLWELDHAAEAEKMFLKIVNSKESFYSQTYRRTSDIQGDSSINLYDYGSYTYDYKNSACLYLTEINIENRKYAQALEFLKLADEKYEVSFSCGTGAQMYANRKQGLYTLCYYGLKMYDVIIKEYLYNYSDWNNGLLVKSIKNKYSREEIKKELLKAETSIKFKIDNFQSSTFSVSGFGSNSEKTEESKYVSGKATINLFGRKLNMPKPDLENNEVASRELFAKEFRESGFYKALTKE